MLRSITANTMAVLITTAPLYKFEYNGIFLLKSRLFEQTFVEYTGSFLGKKFNTMASKTSDLLERRVPFYFTVVGTENTTISNFIWEFIFYSTS